MTDTARPANELRLTLALGTGMLIQAAIALLWAGAAAERLNQLERRAEVTSEVTERTARLEEQMYYVRSSLDRIEQRLTSDGEN